MSAALDAERVAYDKCIATSMRSFAAQCVSAGGAFEPTWRATLVGGSVTFWVMSDIPMTGVPPGASTRAAFAEALRAQAPNAWTACAALYLFWHGLAAGFDPKREYTPGAYLLEVAKMGGVG